MNERKISLKERKTHLIRWEKMHSSDRPNLSEENLQKTLYQHLHLMNDLIIIRFSDKEKSGVSKITAEIVRDCAAVLSVTLENLTVEALKMRLRAGVAVSQDHKHIYLQIRDQLIYDLTKDIALELSSRQHPNQESEEEKKARRKRICEHLDRVAHEMYHVREVQQNYPAHLAGVEATKQALEGKTKEYFQNKGELGARGFAARYLLEKKKLLEGKSRNEIEQVMLDAINEGLPEIQQQLKANAASGRKSE